MATKRGRQATAATTQRIRQLERELAQLKAEETLRADAASADDESQAPDATDTLPQLLALLAERYSGEDLLQAREALFAARSQADLSNRTESEFLARMSHEIRTPMNAIIGLGHLLRETALDSRQQGYLDSMSAAADSLLHIINQVLDFSKIETGKIVLENAHFDLEQMFERLSRLFDMSAGHQNVKITYDIGPEVPRFLRGDSGRLRQVLCHLINNALQHSTSQNVLVSVSQKRRSAEGLLLNFCITDFGVGMTKEQVARLKASFKAVADGEKPVGQSTGLTLCHHLIQLMGGDLGIHSRPDQGCRISFTAWFEHSQIGANTLREQPHRFEQLRALIVDDNALAREIIAGTLQSMRLETDTAENAEDAIEQIRRADRSGNPYQLVLMDYQMPRVDGLTAISRIKADRYLQHPPRVLMVSSFHEHEIFQDQPYARMIDGFLNKPVSESRLFDALSQVFSDGLLGHRPADSVSEVEALSGLRVLLAEDNRVNQQVAEGMLRKRGVTVTVVNNGREALERLYADPEAFDVILMDLEMPELDGYEATRLIRSGKQRADIPILALTAQALCGDRERCLDIGMNGYISKPIKPERLYRALVDIVSGPVAPHLE